MEEGNDWIENGREKIIENPGKNASSNTNF